MPDTAVALAEPFPAAAPPRPDWLRDVLLERGYLAKLRGEAIKVYLALLAESGGRPGPRLHVPQAALAARIGVSINTAQAALRQLERLGLIRAQGRRDGHVTDYLLTDPDAPERPFGE